MPNSECVLSELLISSCGHLPPKPIYPLRIVFPISGSNLIIYPGIHILTNQIDLILIFIYVYCY